MLNINALLESIEASGSVHRKILRKILEDLKLSKRHCSTSVASKSKAFYFIVPAAFLNIN
jgi:hypothetical protein